MIYSNVYIIPILRGHGQAKMSPKNPWDFRRVFVSRFCHVEKRGEPGALNKPSVKWMAMVKHCMWFNWP